MTAAHLRPVALPDDQRELIAKLNETTVPVPETTLVELVARVAADHPDRLALASPRQALTYGQLWRAVTLVADQLVAAGVSPGARVLLCAEYGWEHIAGALAVLRAGAVYVPVSAAVPQTVRWAAAARHEATAVVTQPWLTNRLAWPESLAVCTMSMSENAVDVLAPSRHIRPEQPAVLLEMPGQPTERVALTHAEVINSALDAARRLELGANDRVLSLSPATSTLGLCEMATTLAAGATLVLCQDIDLRRPAAWLDRMRGDQVTVWVATPSLVDLMLEESTPGGGLPESLRAVVVSGERFSPDRATDLRGTGVRVAYATSPVPPRPWGCWHEVTDDPSRAKSVPLGQPMANQRLYVLSGTGEQSPLWVTGQLYAGGMSAGAGAETKHPDTGEALTRTPYTARLSPEAVLEAVGDRSAEVVVQGRPVSLWEVEAALRAHEEVRQVAVLPAGPVAYVRLRSGTGVGAADLSEYLRRKVSPYLLPATIEVRSSLPLTADGLVDRAVLASTVPSAPVAAADPPAVPGVVGTDSQEQELIARVSAIACRLFDVSEIGADVNLLDIGVTSFQLVRLATAVGDELGITVDVEELLRFPSIGVIVSSHLGTVEAAAPNPALAPAVGPAPVSDRVVAVDAPQLTTLVERQAFKDARHGIRHDLDERAGVPLPAVADTAGPTRRSVRAFAPQRVSLAALATLLAAVRMSVHDGEPKFRYPSAGGAYPVQVYLLAAPGRVAGVEGGAYYVHPARDEIIPLGPRAVFPASAHADINRDAFRQSAFSLFLIGRMPAIVPLYGDLALDFTLIEAGALSQLLADVAARCGLGLCPIGTLDTAPLAPLFGLDEQDRFLHALLGGVPAQGARS
ncbi:AMP-binding protein [Micromonospora lutea]|uniref:Carrier domain-containing protein n=1 Tax=Micromonospora lutea TaxID=419825 RepID=A0ABQ4IT52_9ACTN|nr:AMP-binding protein [Micromonospora lutea]GIJ21062.1 hypothetical protein Vlu01_16860 [Micromonospora lutea]